MSVIAPVGIGVLLQLYWLSLLLFGYVIIHAFYELRKRKLPQIWEDAPIFAKIVLAFSATAVVFSVWSLIGYLFRLPSWWLAVSYFATLLFSCLYATTFLRQSIRKDINDFWTRLKCIRIFSLTTIVGVLLVINLALSFHQGAYLFGDAMVHMAKARALAGAGFSLIDPAYGTVMQTSYILTFWHTLLAVPVYFGINIVNSWFYSLPIAKLLIFSSIYYLGFCVLKNMDFGLVKAKFLATFILLMALLLPATTNTDLASYPKVTVIVWITLFVVGLFALMSAKGDYGSRALIVMASILIAMSHPLYALFTLLFLGVSSVAFVFFGRKYLTKENVVTGAIAGIILVITPVIEYIALRSANSNLELPTFTQSYSYWNLFGLNAFVPDIYSLTGTSAAVISLILALIGYGYIIYKLKSKSSRILFISMILTPLFASMPLIFDLLHIALPYWALHRLADVNAFIHVSVAFGIIAILLSLTKNLKNTRMGQLVIVVGVSLVVVSIAQPIDILKKNFIFPYGFQVSEYNTQKKLDRQLINLNALVKSLPEGSTVLAPARESFMLPAVSGVRVIATPVGNTNALVDIKNRITCKERIFGNIDKPEVSVSLMRQAGVDYVVARKNTHFLSGLASSPQYFRLVSENSYDSLYALNRSSIKAPQNNMCTFNE